MKHPIIAIGTCHIVAAASKEGEATKLPTIEIEAYNGGIMDVGYWGPVVIDLAGLTASDSTPILYAHNQSSIDGILGQTTAIANDGKTLAMSGEIMGDGLTSQRVKALAVDGFKFQASVGVDPQKHGEVETGAEIEVNGQTLSGPFTLIEAGKLNEVSVVPMGADGSTSAKIAAEQGAKVAPNSEGVNVKLDAQGNPIVEPAEDGQPTADQIRAEAVVNAKAETIRVDGINKLTVGHTEIAEQAIEGKWTLEHTELIVAKAELAIEKEQNKRPDTPAIVGMRVKEVSTDILGAAVAIRAGLKSADKVFASDTCQKATELKIHSLTDFVRAGLAASGKALEFTRHETREFLQAAFSTRDIANVIAATANKFILEGYGTVEDAWRKVAAVRPVVDFKANTGVRLVMANLLKDLGTGGEIQHGTLSDDTRTVQAETKALMLGVTRTDIINDDLGVLSDLPRRLGFAAARTFNTDFWAAFEAAVATAFTGAHANTTTGALTATTMAAAETLFDALSDNDGNPLGTEASMLLTGSTASGPARDLFISQNMIGGTGKTTAGNRYAGMFEPVKSRYLSAAPWLLVGNPLGVPLMEASFLNGREEPFVETADADFNTLGVQMRCYYDYGTDFAEWRAAVYSTGA